MKKLYKSCNMGQPYLRIEPDQGCSINRQLDDTRASKQYDKRRQFRSSLVLTHTLLLLLLTPTEAKEIGSKWTPFTGHVH